MRIRRTDRWGVGLIYPNPEAFVESTVGDGLHVIQLGNQFLDLLIRDRNSSTTVVAFQHRISPRTTYPTLVGESVTRESGVNLLAVADPSVALDTRVSLAWYLGNRGLGPLVPILLPIIQKCLNALQTSRTIYFGSSGGGYAAMNFASRTPGSIALTVNSTLGFNAQNASAFADYMAGCHGVTGRTAYRRVHDQYAVDLADALPEGADFVAGMYQNLNDEQFYTWHHRPFVQARGDDLVIYERLDRDEAGHTPIPKSKLIGIMSELSDPALAPSEALQHASFARAISRQ